MNLLHNISKTDPSTCDIPEYQKVYSESVKKSHETHKPNYEHKQHQSRSHKQNDSYFLKPIPKSTLRVNDSLYSDYEHRKSTFDEKHQYRRSTISQLREETEQHALKIPPTINKTVLKKYASLHTIDNIEWQKYLKSMHNDLSQKVQYFKLVDKEIPSIWTKSNNDIHIIERTLIQQMKYWIERYGVPGMVAHQELYKLKKDLIVAIEEADTLEEESVQLTQNMFEMENEIQRLKNEQNKLCKNIDELNENIYKMKQKYGCNVPPPPSIINPVPPPPPPLTSSMIKDLLSLENDNECTVTPSIRKKQQKTLKTMNGQIENANGLNESILNDRRPQLISPPTSNNPHIIKKMLLFSCYK